MIDRLLDTTSWWVGSMAVRMGRLGMRPALPLKPPAHQVSFKSLDGLRIAGTYWPGRRSSSPAILIIHGLAACRHLLHANAVWLAARGYAVLTIDLRGHGGSGPALCGFGWSEAQDAHAAVAWLARKQHGAPIMAIGVSMGGAALLLGPHGPVPAQAIVLQGVFADIRRAIRSRVALIGGERIAASFEPLLSAQAAPRIGVESSKLAPIDVVPSLRCPVLVIGGDNDRFTPAEETRALFDAAPQPKALLMMPGLGHNRVSDTRDPVYRERVLAFARETIGDPEGVK